MKLEFQFTKSGRKWKLWHMLFFAAVLGIMFAIIRELLPTKVSPF